MLDAPDTGTALAALRGSAPDPRVATARVAGATDRHAEALKIGRQFEAMYLNQMMQTAFDTVPADSMFGGGNAESIYRSLFIQHATEQIADSPNGLGIAEAVARTLLAAQEGRAQPGATTAARETTP